MTHAGRRCLFQQRQHAVAKVSGVYGRLSRTRPIAQSAYSIAGKTSPPFAHGGNGQTQLLRYLLNFLFFQAKVIVASGIEDMLVDDLRAYNIIDRVTIFMATDAAQEINECTTSLFYLMQKRELSASDLEWPAFKEKLARIQSGELHLMEIEPVAGASAVVLARLIAIESLPIQDAEEKAKLCAAPRR
jgi:hypothetical protein